MPFFSHAYLDPCTAQHLWSCAKVVLGINSVGFVLTALTGTHKLTDLLVSLVKWILDDLECRVLELSWWSLGIVMSDHVWQWGYLSSALIPASC